MAIGRSRRRAGLALSLIVVLLLLGSGGGGLAFAGRTAEGAPPAAAVPQQFHLKIVPLVDYLLLPAGLSCNYGQGSATLLVGRFSANVSLNVQGDVANRSYDVVLITNGGNSTIGTMTVDNDGNGTFTGGTELNVGPSILTEIALRLYYNGQVPVGCFSLDLVGLPFPVTVSAGGAITTTTTTMTSSSQTRSTTSTSNTQSISSSRSSTTSATSSSASISTATVPPTSSSSSLNFRLVSLPASLQLPEPLNYPFRSGSASVIIGGNTLQVTVTLAGAANARFTVVLRANDRNITLGAVSTAAGGTAQFLGDARLDNGTYLIGIRIYQGVQATAVMSASSLVAVSIPLAVPIVIGSGSTSTATSSGSSTATGPIVTSTTASSSTTTTQQTASSPTTTATTTMATQSQNVFSFFSLGLVRVTGETAAYVRGSGTVDIDLRGEVLDISVQLDHVNPNTRYTVVLDLGTSNITLGTFVTNSGGSAELDSQAPVGAGTYSISILVYDDSSFRSPMLVMRGASGQVSIASATSSSTTVETQSQKPLIISVGANAIATALASGTIPAEIQISSSAQQLNIINHNFSVSVGRVSNSGIAITVSGENVTGPRTFLIDLNGSLAQNITSGSFEVLFDGQQIHEAPSLAAVLAPQADAPAMYAVVQTSGGVQLLVSVPHFSTHVIELIGIASFQGAVQTLLEVSLPLLAGAMVVVTLLFGALYAQRKRL